MKAIIFTSILILIHLSWKPSHQSLESNNFKHLSYNNPSSEYNITEVLSYDNNKIKLANDKDGLKKNHTYNSYSCDEFVTFFKKLDSITAFNEYIWGKNIYGPLLLIDLKSRKYYANTNPNEEMFTKEYTCYEGHFPKEIMIGANTIISWKGKQWAIVNLPLSNVPGFDIDLPAHELTHAELGSRGHSISIKNTGHLNTAKGRVLMRLEFELLKKFIHNDRKDVQLLKDALSIRQIRHNEFPDFKANENDLEHNEGLANYSGTIMANLTKERIKSFLTMRITNFINRPIYGREYAYIPMTIYGMKLRESDSLWTQKLTPKTDLTDFLVEAFDAGKPKDLESYLSKYDLAAIVELEKATVQKLNKEKDSIANIFVKGPHLKVVFKRLQMFTNDHRDFVLDEMGRRHFSSMRATDVWGELNVTKGVVMGTNFKTCYIRIPTDYSTNKVVGEGYTLNLNNDYKVVKESDSTYVLKKKL